MKDKKIEQLIKEEAKRQREGLEITQRVTQAVAIMVGKNLLIK